MTNKIIKIKKDYSGLVFGKITVLGYDHSDSKSRAYFKVLIYCDKINLKLYEQSFLDYYSGRGLLYNDLRAFGVSCNVT